MVDSVPAEVLQKIFGEMDESTLFNASLTCQLWMEKLSPRLPSLHHLHIDLDSLSCDGRILYRNVRDTSTTLCQCHEHAVDQGVFLREICQHFGDRLSSVVVEDCLLYKSEKESINDYSILVILRECGENLKSLEFHLLNLRRVRLWTLVIMARFAALSAVHFESCEFPAMLSESIFTRMLAPSFHALETISITNNKLISDKFTLSVAKYCLNLRELNVAGCPKVTALTVVGFCECLPQRRDEARPVDLNLQNTLFNASELSRHLYNPLLSCGPCWKAQPITVTIGYDRSALVLGNVDRSDLEVMTADLSAAKPIAAKWDVLVLTAGSASQAAAFKLQLASKYSEYFCRSLIVEDRPNDAKIGSGGATLNALAALEREFGAAELLCWRTLILHSGGLSQRLAHASALGKLFMTLSDGRCFLEVKLASYVPFVHHLSRQNRQGVMVAASDTLEYFPPHLFDAAENETGVNESEAASVDAITSPIAESYENDITPPIAPPNDNAAESVVTEASNIDSGKSSEAEDILLIAHESTAHIAMAHGVYVTEGGGADLVCVLQKPNNDELKLVGGYTADSVDNSSSSNSILTDSCYFLSTSIVGDLIEAQKKNGEVKCELCAYGDFLRPLGRRPKLGYLMDGRCAELQAWRTIMRELMSGRRAKVLNLGKNSFFHFGSNREMLENFLESGEFPAKFLQKSRPTSNVIHSRVDRQLQTISAKSFVEYSTLSGAFQVGDGCILSGITAENHSEQPMVIAADSLLIGLCLGCRESEKADATAASNNNRKDDEDEEKGYVTLWLSTKDDLKRRATTDGKLAWLEHELAVESGESLWTLPLFPRARSPAESFAKTAAAVTKNLRAFAADSQRGSDDEDDGGEKKISIHDALLSVDHEEMLKIRDKLLKF